MSWFNASQLSTFAKQALSQAQKSIDRVLDIQGEEEEEEEEEEGEGGINSLTSGGWDTSSWGASSNAEPQSQPVSSPTAITKPVRRTVVDESENFFSAFLSPSEVQSIQQGPVVSTPPAKSQRPKEDVKTAIQEPLHTDPPETQTIDFTTSSPVELKNISSVPEEPEENCPLVNAGDEPDENGSKDADSEASPEVPKAEEPAATVKSASSTDGPGPVPDLSVQPLSAETKNLGVETKERKSEDRQSNTPSPPVSTFSSGTSTTSDIEVLDHESVISESSVSSRQEAADSKASLHLMQTSFQLLSASACTEYNRLDDFQKLTGELLLFRCF
ncbi:hypothetical protein JRQ81_003205 [Phrynocephalus forsythii]|uniref:Uncharacterized protein n=1 Tax=Phrynocephalus forsythii TaxID=171643 RepID=A0A9Q0XJD9_9SAUR|nr:hypothetical protein JRQ81_003205 [Phrynocephalus forsythii]